MEWRQHAGLSAESRLAALAAAAGPLRRLLARLAARLIETRAYEPLCYARLGDYARERAGISARQLQELARVHRALLERPLLERAVVANALPWSKARLLARLAPDEDEETWIERARPLTVRQLEVVLRERSASCTARADEDSEPLYRVALRCSPAVREKWNVVREIAERVAGGRVSAGEVLEMVAAEAFSTLLLDSEGADRMAEPARRPSRCALERDGARSPRARALALPQDIAMLGEGLEAVDAVELDRRLRHVLRLEQRIESAMGPLLRVVTSAEYEWEGDYQPLARYAPDHLGISARKARALLRIERAGEVCPELRDAYRSGRLSWLEAQCLLPLLLLDLDGTWRPRWVAWAEHVTLRRLEKDVERALLLRAGHHLAWHRCKSDPARAQDPIPADERHMCAHDIDTEATEELVWSVPREVAALFAAVCETLRRRSSARSGRPLLDGEVFDLLIDHACHTWTQREPGSARPDPVMERDGYLCAVPGCTSRSNLHDHHVVFRSRGGSDDPSNRVVLCAFHHLRCVHAGLLRVFGTAPDALVFELPLGRYTSGDLALPEREMPRIDRRAA